MGDSELINALNFLAEKFDQLSARYVTPLESSLAVQGRTNKLTMEVIAGIDNDLESSATYNGLAYDGTYLYTFDTNGTYSGNIVRYHKETGVVSVFAAPPATISHLCYDSDRKEILAFASTVIPTIWVYNTNGEFLRPALTAINGTIAGATYNKDKQLVYICYLIGSTYYYAKVDTISGVVTDSVSIAYTPIYDFEYANGMFYFSSSTHYRLIIPGANTALLSITIPTSGPTRFIEFDSDRDLFFTQNATGNDFNTLVSPTSVQRFSIYDDGGVSVSVDDGGGSLTVDTDLGPLGVDDAGGSLSVDDDGGSLSVDDGGGSLTVDGTVTADIEDADAMNYNTITVTNAAGGTQIVAANANRKGIIIINMDSTNSVFLGDDASVTTANGLELPPGAFIVYNNYTGVVHGIAENAGVDIRYNELFKT